MNVFQSVLFNMWLTLQNHNISKIFTFLNFRIEAYSAPVGSWLARELTDDRGDLLTPDAPRPVIVPLMVPFPLPPFEKRRCKYTVLFDKQRFIHLLDLISFAGRRGADFTVRNILNRMSVHHTER